MEYCRCDREERDLVACETVVTGVRHFQNTMIDYACPKCENKWKSMDRVQYLVSLVNVMTCRGYICRRCGGVVHR